MVSGRNFAPHSTSFMNHLTHRSSVILPRWQQQPTTLTLLENEVHVLCASLDPPSNQIDEMWQFLSADERDRAYSFRFFTDRHRFVAAHGQLRIILGQYMGVKPNHLRFHQTEYGKPYVVCEPGLRAPDFNMSNSHGLILYAFTNQRAVGVDVEYIRQELAEEQIAERFFSSGEVSALRSLPVELRVRSFFNCWTRKEAFIKAKGIGLSLPLDQFEVALSPEEPAALLKTGWDESETRRWCLHDLDVSPNFAAALAVEGHGHEIKCWQAEALNKSGTESALSETNQLAPDG